MNYQGKYAADIGYQVGIKKLYPDVEIPKYAHEGDAGFDLVANNFKEIYGIQDHNGTPSYRKVTKEDTSVLLLPHHRILIGCGYALEIPKGLQLEIRGRSGNALKYGIVLCHGVGTIDSGYRGEIAFLALNTGDFPITIKIGDRIGQGVLMPVYTAIFKEMDELSNTSRGEKGFGSTGYSIVKDNNEHTQKFDITSHDNNSFIL